MKSLDWKGILEEHPVFSELSEEEIERLLDRKVSNERKFQKGATILAEGDSGDSIFLIGSGEVEVILLGKGEDKIHLNTLGEGEYFGEMALFERQPRSATVIAAERCLLLEIEGQAFLTLVNKHPQIELKVIRHLSARLRRVGQQIIKMQRDLHNNVDFLGSKLEAETRAMEATLEATKTIFEQTNKRANEIIESADRARGRLMWHVTFIGSAIAVILSFLGFFGIKQVGHIQSSIQETKQSVQKSVTGIKEDRKKVQATMGLIQKEAEDAKKKAAEIRRESAKLRTITRYVETFQKFYREHLTTRFQAEMDEGSLEAALELYGEILKTDDEVISNRVFKFINRNIVSRVMARDNLDVYRNVLEEGIDTYARTHRQIILSYYLLLASYIMDSKLPERERASGYERISKKFRDYLEREKPELLRQTLEEDFDVSTFERIIDAMPLEEKALKSRKDQINAVWDQIPSA